MTVIKLVCKGHTISEEGNVFEGAVFQVKGVQPEDYEEVARHLSIDGTMIVYSGEKSLSHRRYQWGFRPLWDPLIIAIAIGGIVALLVVRIQNDKET